MCDELAEGCDSSEVVFERPEFLPEGLRVVERGLGAVVVDFAEEVHLLLFFPVLWLSMWGDG